MLLKLQTQEVLGLLTHEQAKEYLVHGVCRRRSILHKCLQNIYSIFPPFREKLLNLDELADICINLHAFYVNIFGLLDNLAWVLNHEKQLKIEKKKVGLYGKEMQRSMQSNFRNYLNSSTIKDWHNKYLKSYRDALSHRIPLYLPPYSQSIKTGSKEICAYFTHSITEAEGKYMKMHVQLLADLNTIDEIIQKFCEFEMIA